MRWLTCFLNHIMNINVPPIHIVWCAVKCMQHVKLMFLEKKKYNHITSEEYAPMFILLSEQQLNQFPFFAFSSTKIVRASLWNASVAATTTPPERESPSPVYNGKPKKPHSYTRLNCMLPLCSDSFHQFWGFLWSINCTLGCLDSSSYSIIRCTNAYFIICFHHKPTYTVFRAICLVYLFAQKT